MLLFISFKAFFLNIGRGHSSYSSTYNGRHIGLVVLTLALIGCGSGDTGDKETDVGVTLEEAKLSEFPIVYTKRSTDDPLVNLVDLDAFNPGTKLYVRATASDLSKEVNISDRIFGSNARYDIRDINVSYDGRFMVFAARGPYDDALPADEQPSFWNLYEYSFGTGDVYSIMNSDDAGQGHDITPSYLADGRIIFSSSRQQQAGVIMQGEGKPRFRYQVEVDEDDERSGDGFALHVAEFDANRTLLSIEQVTFNRSHDFDPVLLESGKVAFSRWDGSGDRDQVSFYQMNPDGSALEILYGYRSHDTDDDDLQIQFSEPQPLEDGNILALLRTFDGSGYTPNIVKIDINNFVDYDVSITGRSGVAESEPTDFDVATDPTKISKGGRFSYILPLTDGTNRAIVSWSFCRLIDDQDRISSCNGIDLDDTDLKEAPPNYGLWLFDFDKDTQVPLVLGEGEKEAYYNIAVAEPRDLPRFIQDTTYRLKSDSVTCSPGFFEEETGFGMIHIRSVFDMDGSFNAAWVPGATNVSEARNPVNIPADGRIPRFVRFEKPLYIPDPDLADVGGNTAAFGPYMREVLGYAPVQPDGSVKIKVPADVPLMLTIVDELGGRVNGSSDHLNWMQVRPGEVMECNGCHAVDSESPHGRIDGRPASLNQGASEGVEFPDTDAWAYLVDISDAQDGSRTVKCDPQQGETMADIFLRVDPERAELSPDVVFEDVWTDTNQRAADASFSYRYSGIQSVYDSGVANGDAATLGAIPFNKGDCTSEWDALCRVVINYEEHIQPLWEVSRTVTTADGPEVMRCVDCHSSVDPDDGSAQIPAGQLPLTREITNNRMLSYRQILNNGDPALMDDGDGNIIEMTGVNARDDMDNLIPELEKHDNVNTPEPEYYYCWEGDRLVPITIVTFETEQVLNPDTNELETVPVLDGDGHVIPTSFSITEAALGLNVRLSRGGSRASNRFRLLFQTTYEYQTRACGTNIVTSTPIDFDHSQAGLFSETELKMLWEWLDIGSAYYNNPFAVPD